MRTNYEVYGVSRTQEKNYSTGLEEKGYGQEQLREISKMIDAEHSDLFDVLAYNQNR